MYNPEMQSADLNTLAPEVHGAISKRSAELDGVTVTQVTFSVGTKWSQDLKEYAGTDLCELPHLALAVDGTLAVQMTDGSYQEVSQGNVMLLPPGHDAWSGERQGVHFRRILSRKRLLRGRARPMGFSAGLPSLVTGIRLARRTRELSWQDIADACG